jgi:hypothetical protein
VLQRVVVLLDIFARLCRGPGADSLRTPDRDWRMTRRLGPFWHKNTDARSQALGCCSLEMGI